MRNRAWWASALVAAAFAVGGCSSNPDAAVGSDSSAEANLANEDTEADLPNEDTEADLPNEDTEADLPNEDTEADLASEDAKRA